MSTATLEKVTVFITRARAAQTELLLFRHPYAGIQLPAGTVEEDEAHADAALREAQEESGLTALSLHHYIGMQETVLPEHRAVVLHATPVFARPDPGSFAWARFPRAHPLECLRAEDGYRQVSYIEYDQFPAQNYITYQITGWVPAETLTRQLRRHFYHLVFTGDSAETWRVPIDHHLFEPFWAPLTHLPPLVEPQQQWLEYVQEQLQYRFSGNTGTDYLIP